jgi:hypothetical protein
VVAAALREEIVGAWILLSTRGGRRLCRLRRVPEDRLALEERDRVANWDGCARNRRGSRRRCADRKTARAQPTALDETDYRLGIEGQDRRAALAERYRMAEEEDVSRWGRFLKLCGFVGKDFAGGTILLRSLKGLSIPWLLGMKRQGDHMLAEEGSIRRQRQESYGVLARERIRCCVKNGDIVFCVHGNHVGSNELRGTIRAGDENVGLAAVAKSLQHMGHRQNVPLFVNEEAVAKEAVAVASGGRGLIQLIDDRADRGRERGVFSSPLGNDRGPQAAEQASKEEGHEPGSSASVVLRHLPPSPLPCPELSLKKLTAGEEAGKTRKRPGKKDLTNRGNNCMFCNNRNNRCDERDKKDGT